MLKYIPEAYPSAYVYRNQGTKRRIFPFLNENDVCLLVWMFTQPLNYGSFLLLLWDDAFLFDITLNYYHQ